VDEVFSMYNFDFHMLNKEKVEHLKLLEYTIHLINFIDIKHYSMTFNIKWSLSCFWTTG